MAMLRLLFVFTIIAAIAALCGFAQSADLYVVSRSALQQRGCPLKLFATRHGSELVLQNVSDKNIASYRLACFMHSGKNYHLIDMLSASEVAVEPGKDTNEDGFDSTPLDYCRSRKSLVGVASVKFADGSSWESPLVKNIAKPEGERKP